MRNSERQRYRSQAGIVYDIHRTLHEEEYAPPTRLMYGARIPYDRLNELLAKLEEAELVEKIMIEGKLMYRLTPRDLDTLEELHRVRSMLQKIGIRF